MSKGKKLVAPIVQAMLLCDQVYHDKLTGKFVVAGTFTGITSRTVGVGVFYSASVWLFIVFVSAHGQCDLQLRYVSLKDNKEYLTSPKFKLPSGKPLETTSWGIQVPQLPLPHYGRFGLEAYVNDHYVGTAYIDVTKPGNSAGKHA